MTTPNALPKHQQLSEMLIREIAAGHLVDGERLPAERDFAQQLGVAVGTLRKALADLEAKGLLERVQGSGNYVRARAGVESIYALFRLELVDGGGLPTADLIDVMKLRKPEDAPDFGDGPLAHRIRRLRRLSGQPVAAEEIWLDARFANQLTREMLKESLYLFYRETLGLTISLARDSVGVAPCPDWAPAVFDPRPGDCVGFIERLSWDGDGQPAEFSRTWFDPKRARYTVRLK